MTLSEKVLAILVFSAAGVLAVISFRSFLNWGLLLSNAWLYASEEERKKMDKKPYYRQTAVVFLLLSASFLLMGGSIVLQNEGIALLEIPFLAGAVLYAVVSSIRIRSGRK
jgi:hypothetical protein